MLKKYWYAVLSGLLGIGSIGILILLPPSPGIDFVGGSIIEVSGDLEPGRAEVVLEEQLGISSTATVTGTGTVLIRMRELSTDEHVAAISTLEQASEGSLTEERFDVIGPSLSRELLIKAGFAVVLGVLGILVYLTYVFRTQNSIISPWAFGIITIIVLTHDILIASGIYALYAWHTGSAADTLFITALLAILGYSVNDTIVIFNRIVSDMRKLRLPFEELVSGSVRQSITRSINTSTTTLLVLLALLLFGGTATRPFVFTLAAGVIIGTYSSLWFAPQLLVEVSRRRRKRTA